MRYEILRSQLEYERSSFMSHWKELNDYISPRRARFSVSDVNRGERRNRNIIDSTASFAARTLRSGLMSGVTSPARPWFKLASPDPELNEYGKVKDWLHLVSQRMTSVYLRSNLYNVLPIIYGDLGTFGTSAMYMEEDFDNVVRFYPLPIGSYMIANDERLRVNTFFREFRMTVRQLVNRFGVKKGNEWDWSNFSLHIKSAYERGEYETWIDICHVIRPNEDYDQSNPGSKFKKYISCYYERGSQSNYMMAQSGDTFLSEKGYDFFPVLCPRWECTGEDVYGTNCPGMEALGDIKQLQLGEKRSAQAIEKMVNPPMTAPSTMRNQKASILPGDITYMDIREGGQGFKPAHEVNFRIADLEAKQEQIRGRINRAYYADLFLMLANTNRSGITAREIDERHEEKLLALGPVLEQLNQDLLDPLIDNTFALMMSQGFIPEPPEEIQGVNLKVDYISIMAQAQKLVGISSVERFAGFVGQVAGMNPNVLKKVNADHMVDIYADMLSIVPGVVRTDEEVQAINDGEAKQAAAQQKIEMLQQGAGMAKDLSQADMEGDNALTRMMQQGLAGS